MNTSSTDHSFEAMLESSLDWWSQLGIEVPKLSSSQKTVAKRSTPKNATPLEKAKATSPAKNAPHNTAPSNIEADRIEAARKAAASAKTLDALKQAIATFDAGALSDNATQAVFARGNPESGLMIIGEAPGRDEDLAGRPFVGRAGQLLDKMLAAIGYNVDNAYISNICNWRPPGNRNPSPEEIAFCLPFILRHIELIAPKYVLIIGGVSLSALTNLSGIMKNRGEWQSLNIAGQDIPALPIYHPAFLLRRPELKKDAWRDLLSLYERTKSD